MQGRAAVRLARLRRAASVQTVEQLAPLHDYLSLNCAIRKALTDRTQALLTARTLEAEVKAKTAKVGIDRVELKRAERKSRSREAALSKTDVLILRLLLPHERFFSSLVFATVATALHRLANPVRAPFACELGTTFQQRVRSTRRAPS